MKNISNIVNAIKMIAKYGAYVIVIVDVLNFAVERFEALGKDDKQ